jgi:hypothetical protein
MNNKMFLTGNRKASPWQLKTADVLAVQCPFEPFPIDYDNKCILKSK